jgi:uncharacterized membrane protein
MLSLTLENVRLFLHVLAATIWVGGQLVLGGLVPALRKASPDAPRAAAVAFGRIAWPAFVVLLITGGWNIAEESSKNHGDWKTTMDVKMVFVVLSGVGAYLHTKATSAKSRGIWGGVAALAALLALLMGVQLAG